MSSHNERQLAELISVFTKTTNMQTEAIEKVGDEIMKWRAWASVLYLFFTRYYLEKEDPIGLLQSDREFLVNCWKEHGHSVEVAGNIEEIYQTLTGLVQNQLRYKEETRQEDSEDPLKYNN